MLRDLLHKLDIGNVWIGGDGGLDKCLAMVDGEVKVEVRDCWRRAKTTHCSYAVSESE